MRLAICLILAFVCLGCAPGFENKLSLDGVIDIKDPTPGRVQIGDRWVRVDAFTDSRAREELIKINGRSVRTDDAVSRFVTTAFEDLLRMNEYRLAQNHGPILRGEILNWYAEVETGVASKEKAYATIRVAVIDDNGMTRYSSVYNGQSSVQHPFLTESKVKFYLGQAMEEALKGVVKDMGFVQAVETLIVQQP